jgi:hypothetical protein
MNEGELRILEDLDASFRRESVRSMIESFVKQAEHKLNQDSRAPLAWEPVPLALYSRQLPQMICSSWVFVLRAQTNTGAERHPNSHQRMMSYRGSGDFQTWTGDGWKSNLLVSDLKTSIESRWVSIPPNVWHQPLVSEENWVVVSFHTVPAEELIEERPDPTDTELTHQRRYLDVG